MMDKPLKIDLILPENLGTKLLEDPELQILIEDNSGVVVQTRSNTDSSAEGFRDGGAFLIAIASAPAAVAAVKGLFDLFKIIAEKAFELHRLKMEQEHEISILQLEIYQRSVNLPLDQDVKTINKILEHEKLIVIEQFNQGNTPNT